MNRLITKECVPCRGGIPPLSHGLIQPFADELSNWQVMNDHHISRTFVFFDFEDSMKFVNHVAVIAEQEEHHPDIYISYNTVRLDIWTHKIDGLTESDFILAAKIDRVLHDHR